LVIVGSSKSWIRRSSFARTRHLPAQLSVQTSVLRLSHRPVRRHENPLVDVFESTLRPAGFVRRRKALSGPQHDRVTETCTYPMGVGVARSRKLSGRYGADDSAANSSCSRSRPLRRCLP
jgi:hypothetical protein